jgi:hypothetical protein
MHEKTLTNLTPGNLFSLPSTPTQRIKPFSAINRMLPKKIQPLNFINLSIVSKLPN